MSVAPYKIDCQPTSALRWTPHKESAEQVAVLISGGVDSSTAAALLTQAGREVLGITMRLPQIGESRPDAGSAERAAAVCRQLDIAHYVLDVTKPFEQLIVEPFRRMYLDGRTPNPCADCNRLIKFGVVWDFLRRHFEVEYLATGHYAKTMTVDSRLRLAQAEDKTKDQSYFLYGIDPGRLEQILFPLGDYTKRQVRSISARLGLKLAGGPESMDLCFVASGDYRSILSRTEATPVGDILDMQGRKLGEHNGIVNFTIGQRRGTRYAAGEPVYVARIDAEKNAIYLGAKDQLTSRRVTAEQLNALAPDELVEGATLYGKIRAGARPQRCRVVRADDTVVTVTFDEPRFAVCPGQKLVLYNERGCVTAGGTIVPPEKKTGLS